MKKLITLVLCIITIFTLSACSPKTYEMSSTYLKSFNCGPSSFSQRVKNSTEYYVGREEAFDDYGGHYVWGPVYDKFQFPYTIKGASGFTYENCEVKIKVTTVITNIYYDLNESGHKSSKAKKETKVNTITAKLDANGNATGYVTIYAWGPLNAENGLNSYEMSAEIISYSGTVRESK